MSLLFRNWLDEGYYVEDGYGDLTQITDPDEIRNAKKSGTLYEHDGMCMTKVNKDDDHDHTDKR